MAESPKKPSVTEEYELGDSSFDPELDTPRTVASVREPAVPPTTPSAPPSSPPAAQPQDPETGRFVKKAHAPRLIQAARTLGLSQEEIDELSPADLRETVHFASLERLASQRDRSTANYVEGNQSGVAAPEGGGHAATPSPSSPPQGIGLSKEFLDGLHDEFRSFLQNLHADVAALKGQVQAVHGHQMEQVRESTAAQLDRQFEAFADEGTFGKGRGQEMAKDSPEYRRRMALIREAVDLAGGPDKPLAVVLSKMEQARTNLYGTTATPTPPVTPPRSNGTPPAAGWPAGAGLARPTQRQPTDEPKGANRATRAVAAKMRDRGLNEESFEGIEEAGLPE